MTYHDLPGVGRSLHWWTTVGLQVEQPLPHVSFHISFHACLNTGRDGTESKGQKMSRKGKNRGIDARYHRPIGCTLGVSPYISLYSNQLKGAVGGRSRPFKMLEAFSKQHAKCKGTRTSCTTPEWCLVGNEGMDRNLGAHSLILYSAPVRPGRVCAMTFDYCVAFSDEKSMCDDFRLLCCLQ